MSTVKIAQFKTTDACAEMTCYFTFVPRAGYIQTSEWVEVEFPPVASSELLKQQLSALEKLQAEAFAKYDQARIRFQAAQGEPA